MAQYIDKSVLVAEIEKLVDKGKYYEEFDCAYRVGNNDALYALKDSINTLEVKEVDFETAFAATIDHFDEKNDYGQWLESDLREFAEHFFELGLNAQQEQTELPNGEDYGIDSLYHAARILEKTIGEVDGYQSDDGILEHKCAIEAVNRLYKQKPTWSEKDERMFKNTIALIETFEDYNKAPDGFGDVKFWLKSLKERMKGE